MPPENDLVKIKRFEMKPMTVEEAALQIQMLGHTFFMFLDREPALCGVPSGCRQLWTDSADG